MEKHADNLTKESHPSAESESLWRAIAEVVRERFISFRTMDPPLRLVAGVAIAQLVATAIMIGANSWLTDTTPWILPASIVSLAMAWTFVLCGAMESHWSVTLLVLLLFSYVIWADKAPFHLSPGHDPRSAVMTLRLVLSAAVWLLAGYVSLRRRSIRAGVVRRAGRLLFFRSRFAVLAVLLLGYYLLLYHVTAETASGLFYAKINHQIRNIALIVTPALLLAATDWVDIIDVATRAIAQQASLTRRYNLLVLAAGGIAIATLAFGLPSLPEVVRERIANVRKDELQLVYEIGLFAILMILLVIVLRRTQIPPPEEGIVPFWAIAATAIILGGSNVIAGKLSTYGIPAWAGAETSFSIYHDPKAGINIAYPTGWPVVEGNFADARILKFDGTQRGIGGIFYWIEQPKNTSIKVEDLISRLFCGSGCSVSPFEDWRTSSPGKEYDLENNLNNFEGAFFVRDRDDKRVIVGGIGGKRYFWTYYFPLLASFIDSTLIPNTKPPPPRATSDPLREVARAQSFGMMPMVLAIAGFLLVMRTHHEEMRLPGFFVFVTGFAGIVFFRIREFGTAVEVHSPLLIIQLVVAAATLAVSVVFPFSSGPARERLTKLLALLFTLCAGLFGLGLLYLFYGRSVAAEETSALIAALLLLVFLMWDILMSGKEVTNIRGTFFPRHSRVLLYLGYIMLVSTAVLFFSLPNMSGGGTGEPFIEVEYIVREGFLKLGLPLLLTGFLVGSTDWWRGHARHDAHHEAARPDWRSSGIIPATHPASVKENRKLHKVMDCLKALAMLIGISGACLVGLFLYLGVPYRMNTPGLIWTDTATAHIVTEAIVSYGLTAGAIVAFLITPRYFRGLPCYFVAALCGFFLSAGFTYLLSMNVSIFVELFFPIICVPLMHAWVRLEPRTREYLARI